MDDLRAAVTSAVGGARASVTARLRRAGLRATRPRVHLLEWLDGHPGHHAAETLIEHTGLARATVYHALGQLHGTGLLLTADAGAGRVLYETATGAHDHFVCRTCGRVVDVSRSRGPLPSSLEEVPGGTVDEVEVILRGSCGTCAAAGRAS